MLGALAEMAIHVVTKDCTALSDSDLAEMGDLAEVAGNEFGIGILSKEAEAWVLVTLARHEEQLAGFAFCTLERIGGTPSVLIGLAHVERSDHSPDVMAAIMRDQMRRAVLAFPDEDVLIGTRMVHANAFEAFGELNDIVPRPGHKASGEERAWGRRLAKRFGIEAKYDPTTFTSSAGGNSGYLDHESSKPEKLDPAIVEMFSAVPVAKGGVMVVYGWTMAEDLIKLGRR